MSSNGDCFIVLPEKGAANCLIVGRNAEDPAALIEGVAQEVHFYDVTDVLKGKTDGGVDVAGTAAAAAGEEALRIILQKPEPGVWGGDFGANDRSVAVGITWSAGAAANDTDCLQGTDIVRLTLAQAINAEDAVERIGALIASHGSDSAKLNFVACDATAAWLISCSGKVWAAEKLSSSYLRVPSGGLTVTTIIDKSSEGLDKAASFAAAHDAEVLAPDADWCGPSAEEEASYTQRDMFETLRAASNASSSRAANVSVLSGTGICCHWFTATPNASESVFKPFVFAPRPRISPLTKVQPDWDVTLLHKLHGQRKPAALEHLRSLEASCVEELNHYFGLQNYASDELDELLKDCVEAEVKFYR